MFFTKGTQNEAIINLFVLLADKETTRLLKRAVTASAVDVEEIPELIFKFLRWNTAPIPEEVLIWVKTLKIGIFTPLEKGSSLSRILTDSAMIFCRK